MYFLTFLFLLDKNIEKIQESIRHIDAMVEAISEWTDIEIKERFKDALITDLENMKKTLSYEEKST